MKKHLLLLLLIVQFGFSQAGLPANPYYNGMNWTLTGMNLKNALATKITATHTITLTYAQAELAIKTVDLDPADATNTNLLLLYGFSNNLCPASSSDDKDHRRRDKSLEDAGTADPCLWNKEHTYARASGVPALGTSGPGADVHNLRACDKKRNADRDNDRFFDGSGNSFESGLLWYPGDEWKGDVARMMMYMYLRYGSQCLPTSIAQSGIPTATNDSNMVQFFLEWNAEDPVSQYEDNRNNYLGNTSNTYAQGNRNPFIDNPYLATVIWGGPAAENRWPTVFLSSQSFIADTAVQVYPNPTNSNEIEIATEEKITKLSLVNINGQIIKEIAQPIFNQNTYKINNLPQGFYFLQINAEKGSLTKKIIVN
jgi:endonuclease I